MKEELTYQERLLLCRLVDEGPQVDHDTEAQRVLVGWGYATRHADSLTGIGMIIVTDAGRVEAGAL